MSIVELDRSESPEIRNMRIKLDAVLQEVAGCIAPVWPLKDYVAVNPYFGLVSRGFMSARTFLRVFSECEMLMPLEYYAARWRADRLDAEDIDQALAEIDWPHTIAQLSTQDIVQLLIQASPDEQMHAQRFSVPPHPIRSVVEHAAAGPAIHWREIIVDEVSKFCAAYYDDGQASWGNAWKNQSLYSAWHNIAQVDRNAEMQGLIHMRKLVASLPREPRAAIVELLCLMQVPYPLWSTVLLSQVFSMPGWFAWAKYQDQQATGDREPQSLVGLLAIRLAYDYAVGRTLGLQVNWSSYLRNGYASFQREDVGQLQQAWVRYTLLRASEIRYRRQLLNSLPKQASPQSPAASAAINTQMVFCIDVRSERIRRHLESLSSSVETLGFAGFFGLPIEFLPLGETQPTAQLPVLLKPQHCVHECLCNESPDELAKVQSRRTRARWWRRLWQSFKVSSISSFGFVESSGLLAAVHLIRQSLGYARPVPHHLDGVSTKEHRLRPDIGHDRPGAISLEQQVEIAERALTNLGLTRGLARLVVFCGHFSQTSNNPLAAGLDCGACGGHSGAPNARWLAAVLNQTDVRLGLCQRGIEISAETYFVAAAHNTTTDAIEFFDTDDLPASHRLDFEELRATCREASAAVANERLPQLNARRPRDILKRASNWSEVRPEWGLAGNAAFIVGPRSLTSGLNLNGQTFLHSYEASQDPTGAVLETIMTAPMIVANWINMQYYASAVDNRHFGSGSKTIHNVVGKFGILAGNAGDLKTGLPIQSLHDGTQYRHLPQRLLVVICAPRASIERVYLKHELVANLVNNEWLFIVAWEAGQSYRLGSDGQWQSV